MYLIYVAPRILSFGTWGRTRGGTRGGNRGGIESGTRCGTFGGTRGGTIPPISHFMKFPHQNFYEVFPPKVRKIAT